MRLRPHSRGLVVFRSSTGAIGKYGASPDGVCKRGVSKHGRRARTSALRRLVRIGALLTIIAVRPRWRPLLAGMVLTVLGVMERQGAAGILVIPGLLLLSRAVLIAGDTDADRERRSRLKRELAAYSTAAQRGDLEATLDRYPDGITYEMRDILARQATAADRAGPYTG